MKTLQGRTIAAAFLVVLAVAALAIVGARAWSVRAHESFRDDVVLVLSQRFHRVAAAVPADPDTIEVGGRRRDLRALYEATATMPAPARADAIYRAFLGDTTTVGRAIVSEDPFAGRDVPDETAPPASFPPKRLKTLRIAPDRSEAR